MNFLYGGGGSKAPSSDGHQPIQLPRTRVKLQPRRLRCTGGAPPEPELPERQVRTHIFMDLVANGPREAAPRRASPGLMDKLRPSSARKESWRRQQRSDEQAAAAAGAADPERPPAPRQGAAEELVSLDQLDQDCFIVPFDMVDRFLPAGHKLPATPPAQGQRLSMRETHNPGLGVVIHLLGHLLPVAPSALDPAPPRHVQLGACATLLRQAVQMGGTRDAMLLSNLERTEEFPFLLYYTVDKQRRSAPETYKAIVRAMQATFSRLESTYVADHTIKLFDEVRSLAFNQRDQSLVALSLNAYVHLFDAVSFKQKLSRKLPHSMDNVCLALGENCKMYAVGSKSHTTILDPKSLKVLKKITAKYHGCSIRSLSFNGDILTIGTGNSVLMFYDLRAQKYLDSGVSSGRAVVFKATSGWVSPRQVADEPLFQDGGAVQVDHTPAIYTHCYDASGTRLFTAGGPLNVDVRGCYAGLWM